MTTSRHSHKAACTEPLESRRLLAAGDPDFAFSTDGRTTLNFPGAALEIADTAVAPDGKVVVGGRKGTNMAVARLNSDGTLDTAFGNGGLFETDRRSEVTSVAVQGDGKIIVALGWDSQWDLDLHVGRLLQNGSGFDPAFGSNGIAHVGDRWSSSHTNDVMVQRDGKIIGAGSIRLGTLLVTDDFVVVRFNEDGSPDTTFGGGDGISEHGFGEDERIAAVTIDYNDDPGTNPRYGTIVAVGSYADRGFEEPGRFALLRLRPDGTPDSSFSGDGLLVSPDLSGAGIEAAADVVVQPGGRVVVAGTAGTADPNVRNFLIARYTAAGALDNSFGLAGGGVTELDFGNTRDEVGAIAIGYHGVLGNLVVAGSRNNQFALVALRPDGQLDTRFHGDGILTTTIPGHATGLFATGSLFPPNRRLVIAGGNGQVARHVDVGSVITVGTLQPQMYEQNQQATSFVVARTLALPFAETIILGTSGTATTRGANRDFNAENIIFGNGTTTVTHVVISANQTFVNVVLTPIDDTLVEGDETIGFTANTGIAYDAGSPNNTTLVVRDNDTTGGPVVISSGFLFETAPQRVTFRFSQNVAASVSAADFQVTGPTGVPPSTFSYDGVTNTATLSFNGILPNGDFTARAIAAGITNASGQPMPADHVLDFFFLGADANRDGRVNLQDFNRLAANFGTLGKTFSQGNFNYDTAGNVNLQDFNVLATWFGTALGSAAAPSRSLWPPRDGGPFADETDEGRASRFRQVLLAEAGRGTAPDDSLDESELRKLLDELA
jgi:uncharacterized delta-60 repeat protein